MLSMLCDDVAQLALHAHVSPPGSRSRDRTQLSAGRTLPNRSDLTLDRGCAKELCSVRRSAAIVGVERGSPDDLVRLRRRLAVHHPRARQRGEQDGGRKPVCLPVLIAEARRCTMLGSDSIHRSHGHPHPGLNAQAAVHHLPAWRRRLNHKQRHCCHRRTIRPELAASICSLCIRRDLTWACRYLKPAVLNSEYLIFSI